MGLQRPIIVRDVWAENLEEEMALIRTAITEEYRYVSMDTEFPGTIFTPDLATHLIPLMHPFDNYRYMKVNVESLKLIQLGLTLSDAHGNLPGDAEHRHVWQFNLRDFDADREPHNPESIALLKRQGIEFARNKERGIHSVDLARLFIQSGLICNESLTWVTFHGAYDFGFLVKALIQHQNYSERGLLEKPKLPDDLGTFLGVMKKYFGNQVLDVKHMIKECDWIHGGLERIGWTLGVGRAAGKSHQAGSDSLLTMQTFMRVREVCFEEQVERFNGVLYGLERNRCCDETALMIFFLLRYTY